MTTAATAPMRVGVYGGAFDPPHLAHLALARNAIAQLALDRLQVTPTGQAWHKPRNLSDAAHRLAMARLLFAGVPQVVIDDAETRRAGASYTIDTLEHLRGREPQAKIFLLIGEDQLAAFCSWHRWRDVLALAVLCVARRGGGDRALALPWSPQEFPSDAPPEVVTIHMPPMSHASTEIRALLARGESAQPWVGEDVSRYIANHHLYQAA